MILRTILFVLRVVELLLPRQLVDFWMGIAAAEGADVELRPWVYAVARVEGLVIVLWTLSRHAEATRTARSD